MSNSTHQIPPDDPARHLTVSARPDADLPHLSVVGDTYTILVSGDDTAGQYCLIDMHVPPGGGPPPHRHDFEEFFHVLDGEIEVTFRGETQTLRAGQVAAVPRNAPHSFTNAADAPARLLCLCSPAGQDAFFLEVGDKVNGPTSPPPALSEEQKQARVEKARRLAAKYRTEMVQP